MNEHYVEKVCPVCGKVFYPGYLMMWGWKNPSDELVCSYRCQRKSEKKPKSTRKPLRSMVAVRIVETGQVFESISDCAAHFHTSTSALRHSIYEGRDYKGYHIERVVK